jgi:hypothetical protein
VALVTPDSAPCVVGLEVHARVAKGLVRLACDVPVITQVGHDDPNPGIDTLKQGLTIPRFPNCTRSNRFPVALPPIQPLRRDADTFHIFPADSLHASAPLPAPGAATHTIPFSPRSHGTEHAAMARTLDGVLHPIATRVLCRASAVLVNQPTSFDRLRSTHTSRRSGHGLRAWTAQLRNRMALFPICCSSATAMRQA